MTRSRQAVLPAASKASVGRSPDPMGAPVFYLFLPNRGSSYVLDERHATCQQPFAHLSNYFLQTTIQAITREARSVPTTIGAPVYLFITNSHSSYYTRCTQRTNNHSLWEQRGPQPQSPENRLPLMACNPKHIIRVPHFHPQQQPNGREK